jgi:hypothetical protein
VVANAGTCKNDSVKSPNKQALSSRLFFNQPTLPIFDVSDEEDQNLDLYDYTILQVAQNYIQILIDE